MVLIPVFDFAGGEKQAVRLSVPKPVPQEADYLVFDGTDREFAPALLELAQTWGSRLLVRDVWRRVLPQAGLLISTAVTGGTVAQRLSQHPLRRRWLLRTPMAAVFPLPCPQGTGTPLSQAPDAPGFYSEALCCRYDHRPDSFRLWDTEETMAAKLTLAQSVGFCGYL